MRPRSRKLTGTNPGPVEWTLDWHLDNLFRMPLALCQMKPVIKSS